MPEVPAPLKRVGYRGLGTVILYRPVMWPRRPSNARTANGMSSE